MVCISEMEKKMFQFLGSKRSAEVSEKKLSYWTTFLAFEDQMLNLFDGSVRGSVKVTESTILFDVGTYSVSQLRARVLSKLYFANEDELRKQISQIQNETLKMVVENELMKIWNSKHNS